MNIGDVTFYVTRVADFIFFLVIILGILGNALTLKIYSRPVLKKATFGIYFRVASVADLLVSFYSITFLLKYVFNYDLNVAADFICKTLDYTFYVAGPVSGHMLVLVALDRFLSVRFPRKFATLFKKKFQISIIAFIVTFNGLYYNGFLWNKQLEETFSVDNITNETTTLLLVCQELPLLQTFYQMDVFNSALVPYFLMALFSALTILAILKSRTRINLSSQPSTGSVTRRDRKFALTSVALNTMFLLLNLPVLLLIAYGENIDPDLYNMMFYILNIIYFVNYAIGFYVQIVFNSIFRSEFFLILNLQSAKSGGDNTNSVINSVIAGTNM
jgi:hypothetical protein